jgi:hypothetical protein
MHIPDIPFNLQLGLMVGSSPFSQHAQHADQQIRPFLSQYDMGVGDTAIMASTHSIVDKELIVLKLIDPKEYVSEYPDWEKRMENSFVLCEWIGRHNREGATGWFSRVKLIQITFEQYEEAKGWIQEPKTQPETPPDWVDKAFEVYTDHLAVHAPDSVPKRVTCGNCGGRDVQLHALSNMRFAAYVGEVTVNGETRYVMISDKQDAHQVDAHLHCDDCGHRASIDPGEINFQVD